MPEGQGYTREAPEGQQKSSVAPVEQETIAELVEMEIKVEQETKDKPADMESTRLDQVTMVEPTVQKTKAEMVEVDEHTTLVLAAQKTMAGPVGMGQTMPL